MMNNRTAKISTPTLKTADEEYLKRERHFIAEAANKPELKGFFTQDYSAEDKLAPTPGFINLILNNLEKKQQEKHRLLVNKIKGIFLQQDQHTADTLVQLVSDLMEPNQSEKNRVEILKQIFKRANSSAERMVKVLLDEDMEKSDLSLAKLDPKRYEILQQPDSRKDFINDTKRFCKDYIFLGFLIQVNTKLYEQTDEPSKKFELNQRIKQLTEQSNKYIPETVLKGLEEVSQKPKRKLSLANITTNIPNLFSPQTPRQRSVSVNSSPQNPSTMLPKQKKIDASALVRAASKLKKVEQTREDEPQHKSPVPNLQFS